MKLQAYFKGRVLAEFKKMKIEKSMKNLLSLHEAITVALINLDKKKFTAHFDEIAAFIVKRGLADNRKGNVDLATQVMLRSTKSKKRYSYLFEEVGKDAIRLRTNSNK